MGNYSDAKRRKRIANMESKMTLTLGIKGEEGQK